MRRIAPMMAALVLAAGCNDPTQPGRENAATQPTFHGDNDDNGAVVQVARPTGDPAIDVPNIQAAVDAATPGSTIQFARGTYRILETTNIVVSDRGVTLQGHRRGTTIRGVTSFASPDFFVGHFYLNGGRQTVRNLTFDGFATAISIGEAAPAARTGGYRIENSTFKNGDLAFEMVTFSDQVSKVQGNNFVDVGLQFFILGKTVHFRGNRNTNPNPAATPAGRPINAGVLLPEFLSGIFISENNRFEENRVEGNADGFILFAGPVASSRNNVVRGNTFVRQRVFLEPDGTTFDNATMIAAIGPGVDGNLFKDNVLRGSEGMGIIVEAGSDNRIVDNRFFDLPGERPTFDPFPGTGIVLGEATSGNVVRENVFKRVLTPIVDLGTGNIIKDEEDDDDDDDLDGRIAARFSVTGKGLSGLDHPKLRMARERMRN
jgi:hypothetical protein